MSDVGWLVEVGGKQCSCPQLFIPPPVPESPSSASSTSQHDQAYISAHMEILSEEWSPGFLRLLRETNQRRPIRKHSEKKWRPRRWGKILGALCAAAWGSLVYFFRGLQEAHLRRLSA